MTAAKRTLILLAILFIGLVLRIHNLDTESMWLDEGTSIKLAQASPITITIDRAFNNHPPLYFLILHYWIRFFGNSVFSARFLSVLFGFLALYMIYKVGGIIFDTKTALLGAFILALSLFHIYYSQEIRMYSLVVFLSLVSMYFFIRFFEKKNKKDALLYVVATVLLLYTHYSGLLVVFTQNLCYAGSVLSNSTKPKRDIKKWIICQALLFILYMPWLLLGIFQLQRVQSAHFWLPEPTLFWIPGSFVEYSGSLSLFIIFSLLTVYALLSARKNRFSLSLGKKHFLLLWLSIPVVIPFLISKLSAPLYLTKYTIAASLAFYLLIAAGIADIKQKHIKILVVVVIVLFSVMRLGQYYSYTNKIPWKDVAAYIGQNAKPGDLIIFNDTLCSKEVFEYYFKRKDVHKTVFPERGPDVPYTAIDKKNIEDLWQVSRGRGRIWIVLAHTIDIQKLIERRFGRAYKIVYHKIYPSRSYINLRLENGIEVFLLEKG